MGGSGITGRILWPTFERKQTKPHVLDAMSPRSHWYRSRLKTLEQVQIFSATYIITPKGVSINRMAINRIKPFFTITYYGLVVIGCRRKGFFVVFVRERRTYPQYFSIDPLEDGASAYSLEDASLQDNRQKKSGCAQPLFYTIEVNNK